MFKPTGELEEYITLVTRDFSDITTYEFDSRPVELRRQEDTRNAIIALLKTYKEIPLSENEAYLLIKFYYEKIVRYNDRDYDKLGIENKIAFIACNIGEKAREKVLNIKLEMYDFEVKNPYSFEMVMYDSWWCRTHDEKEMAHSKRPSEVNNFYLDILREYNHDMNSAFVSFPWSEKSELVHPSINFDGELFVEVIPKRKKVLTLIRKCMRNN